MDIKIGKLKYVPGKGENTIRSISMNGRLIFKEVDPRKGEKKPTEPQSIPRGSTVDLELYKGEDAEPKEVPNLLCSTYEEAMLLILGNEFYIGTVHVAASAKNDTLGAYIVKQSPRPGTEASMGTGIDIWIERKRPEECE
jgi:beta-lactam-binding protein with PASTA domain